MKNKIEIDGSTIEFDVESKDAPIVERHFYKYTKRDLEIRNKPLPNRPLWLNGVVRLIRFYQTYISQKLGNRCVFDPSCSHYSEVAFRKKGFVNGMKFTLKRLHRCRPKNGGVDELM